MRTGLGIKPTLTIALMQQVLLCGVIHWALTSPIDQASILEDDDPTVQLEYDNLKYLLVSEWGKTQGFADLVETNLKRAIREEKIRQLSNIDPFDPPSTSTPNPFLQRQNQGSDEYDDDDATTPTTPRASPTDVVRGVAQLLTSLGTFNVGNFWSSFVNFFPPGQRQGAQALVEAALGRRPQSWPTMPTTKATTTPKDEDELDSDETTKRVSATAVGVTSAPSFSSAATIASNRPVPVPSSAEVVATITPVPAILSYTEAEVETAAPHTIKSYIPGSIVPTAPPSKAPTTKYAVRRRTGTVRPSANALDADDLSLRNELELESSSEDSGPPTVQTESPTKF